jgi:multicomponent Na+:H+ antiporter subunit B
VTSLILRTTARLLLPLLLLFSVFLLQRGHNEPGGGFAGGLVAGIALALYALAYDPGAARRVMRVDPQTLIAVGLAVSLLSGVVSLLQGDALLAGRWGALTLPDKGEVWLGTPLLFDVGVYLTVLGVASQVILTLAEE